MNTWDRLPDNVTLGLGEFVVPTTYRRVIGALYPTFTEGDPYPRLTLSELQKTSGASKKTIDEAVYIGYIFLYEGKYSLELNFEIWSELCVKRK